jgi:SAM-dependent methyltransferase
VETESHCRLLPEHQRLTCYPIGIWAIDFADAYPNARVIGTDLSPIQPAWVPPNLEFFVDDVEAEWTFKRYYFDFVRCCDLGGSIADWPKLLRQAHRHMKHGGWLELSDFEMEHFSDDDTLHLSPSLGEFFRLINEASTKFNRPMNVAPDHKKHMEGAGFVDVTEKVYKVSYMTAAIGGNTNLLA